MLTLRNLEAFYGRNRVLKDLDLALAPGKITVLVGANGAGKTTLLRCIAGVHPQLTGRIELEGREISGLDAASRVQLGIGLVPEGREVFSGLTVKDNLLLGAYRRGKRVGPSLDAMYERFPLLAEHAHRPAGLLSGGQQQILAVARCLMSVPRVLLFDEPSMGLSPLLTQEVFRLIGSLRSEDTAILLVEQNARAALQLADYGAVLELGEIVLRGTGRQLLNDPQVREAYLGV